MKIFSTGSIARSLDWAVDCPMVTSKLSASSLCICLNLEGSCSAKRRQPCEPSNKSKASEALGCSPSKTSVYSRSCDLRISVVRRKWVGMERAVFSSAMVITLLSTTPSMIIEEANLLSSSEVSIFSLTFWPGT